MTENDARNLRESAFRVRQRILRMATGGGAFAGSALSCADLLVYLYKRFLTVRAGNLSDPSRDYFLLSKGHAVPALYATLAEEGILDEERLARHLSPSDHVYWHPNRALPGVEFHSGSLGHLLAVGVGIALDCAWRGGRNRVVVLLGDGELNEGSVWEAILLASARRLDNLVVAVDRNGLQANLSTEELLPLEPLEEKFRAFGLVPATVDGHDFDSLHAAFGRLPFEAGRPSVVIAKTVRGKGVPSMEGRVDRWFCNFTERQVAEAQDELARAACDAPETVYAG
jgi:transketolase